MAESRKSLRRASGTASRRQPADVQPLTLERHVVDLLELLQALSAKAELAAKLAGADGRTPARELVELLTWLKAAGGNGSEAVQGLSVFLQAVSASQQLEETEGTHG